jgi:hypothetical protein
MPSVHQSDVALGPLWALLSVQEKVPMWACQKVCQVKQWVLQMETRWAMVKAHALGMPSVHQ